MEIQNPIIQAARSEQQELEKSISALDAEYASYETKRKALVQRLDAVKALRNAYGDNAPSQVAAGSLLDEVVKIGEAFSRAIVARENSHKARVLSAAIEILKDGAQIRTQPLLEEIEKRGVEFNARDKAGNLSVILSKDDRFVSDRRYGWSLKKENPQDAATSAGSSTA